MSCGPRILIITPLDYERMQNNTEHHMVRCLSDAGWQVTVMYRAMNRSGRLVDMIRDTLSFGIRREVSPEATLIRVDPPFNYYAGLRVQAEASHRSTRQKPSLRTRLIRLFSPLSVLRDMVWLPCFVLAAFLTLRGRYDVCLGAGPWGSLAAWVLRRLRVVGMFVYLDRDFESGLVPDRLRRSYTARLEAFLLRRCDHVLTIGHRLAALRKGQTTRPIHLLPSGVDHSLYESARQTAKQRSVLIYVGNVISWSGLELAIRAMPTIWRTRPDVRLRIVGDGLPGYVGYLKHLAAAIDPLGRIEFLGAQAPERLPELLAGADVGLANSEPVPYRQYACPLKLIEYMAAGLPAIVTADTEAAEIVERCESGMAVAYQQQAFAIAVLSVLNNPASYEKLRNNAIRESLSYDWHGLMNQVMSRIQHCCTELRRKVRRPAATRRLRIGIDARPLLKQRTGVERMAFHFVDNLARAGGEHEYVLFVDRQPEAPLADSAHEVVVVEPRAGRLQKFFDAWIAFQLPRELRRRRVDVFMSPHTKFPFAPIPRFTTVHGLEWHRFPQGYPKLERLKQWFWFTLACRFSAGIITFAQNTARDIKALRPGCRVPVCVTAEAADTSFRRLNGTFVRDTGAQPYILSVCSLEPRKNIDGLLRAFALLIRQRQIPHRLMLVGRAAWRSDELRSLCRKLDIESRVEFAGYVPDAALVEMYNRAALFVYPSKYEGFGLPVLEAMACGVPVVTSRNSSLAEVAGSAAILVDPGSHVNIAEGIGRALFDTALRQKLIKAGSERAATFSWEGMTRKISHFMAAAELDLRRR